MKIVKIYRKEKLVATITTEDDECKNLISEVLSIFLFADEEGYVIKLPEDFHAPTYGGCTPENCRHGY